MGVVFKTGPKERKELLAKGVADEAPVLLGVIVLFTITNLVLPD